MASFVVFLVISAWIVDTIGLSQTTASSCTDNLFLNCSLLTPEMCEHDCVAKVLCPGFCNTCRRKCYQCDAVDRPEECHTRAVCQPNQVCIVTQTFTQSLEEKFRLGCVDKSICMNLYGSIQSRRSISFDGGCCDHNYCNKHDPDISTVVPIPEEVTTPLVSPLNQCQDLDANFCTHGGTKECYISCFANMCPVTCKKCVPQGSLQCLSCPEVNSAAECNNTKVCKQSEVCIATETQNSDFQRKAKLDCVSRTICGQLNLTVVETPGTSSTGHVDGYCCNTSNCNSNPLPTPETTTLLLATTTLNPEANPECPRRFHQCPINFVKLQNWLNSSCYLFTENRNSFDVTSRYCHNLCARPVIISTTEEGRALTHHILQSHNLAGPFWTDGIRTHEHTHWIWKSSNHDVMSSLFVDLNSVRHGKCLVFGRETSSHLAPGGHFYADGRSCSESYKTICELILN